MSIALTLFENLQNQIQDVMGKVAALKTEVAKSETETPTVDQETVEIRKKVLLDYDEMYNKAGPETGVIDQTVDLDMRIRTLEDVCGIGGDDSERRLKPCPFCLNVRGADLGQDLETDYFAIYCVTCKCKGPPYKTVREARAAWNKRN